MAFYDNDYYLLFPDSTRSANGLLMNVMMSDENHRDIYISTVAMPPLVHCPSCRDMAIAYPGEQNITGKGVKSSLEECLEFMEKLGRISNLRE